MRNGVMLLAIAVLALAACDAKQDVKPATSVVLWWEKYSLDCDGMARIKSVKECVAAYYQRNGGENPELESEMYDRCRLAASVMYCNWRKP